jgi:hypothetical protein
VVIGGQDDLGIAFSDKAHAVGLALELVAKLDVVINLSVKQDGVTLRRLWRPPPQRLV